MKKLIKRLIADHAVDLKLPPCSPCPPWFTLTALPRFFPCEICPRRLFSVLMSDVIQILNAIDGGDPHAADQLLPLLYDDLRQLAAQKLAQEYLISASTPCKSPLVPANDTAHQPAHAGTALNRDNLAADPFGGKQPWRTRPVQGRRH